MVGHQGINRMLSEAEKLMHIKQQTKDALKKTAYWILPQGFQSVLKEMYSHFRSMCLPKEMKTLFARNEKFYNIHKGKRCFILATGPSINKQDLRPLRNEICIAVSAFYVHKEIKTIRPLYHVEAPSHPPFGIEVAHTSFEGYRKNYSDETIYFLGHSQYVFSYFNYLKQNPHIKKDNFYFLNYCYPIILNENNYNRQSLWDICSPLFAVRTVIYSAIQIAAYMGFKEIYLLGCDHDYLMDLNRITDHHFYKDEESGISDAEHLSAFNTEWWFCQYYYRWKEYRLMNDYLTSNGCRIFNATNGGMLDVFPRVNFDDVIRADV